MLIVKCINVFNSIFMDNSLGIRVLLLLRRREMLCPAYYTCTSYCYGTESLERMLLFVHIKSAYAVKES